ncbi:MAG: hypothetical protein MJK04_24595 [Psychrosphaera sp.]|nr:hypothetical protein [Psychrosphaera sp.]
MKTTVMKTASIKTPNNTTTTNMIFTAIRWISAIAIIAVLCMGFVISISITQALIFNPVILLSLMGCYVYAGFQLSAYEGEELTLIV